jgi:DNA-binding protein H-NS
MPRTASLTRLEAQIRELEKKAEAIKQQQKPGLKQLKTVISKYRLTPADIKFVFSGASRGNGSALRGKKLKPKYRNPANKNETWAGRGLKPKWVSRLLKQGKKLEDLVI